TLAAACIPVPGGYGSIRGGGPWPPPRIAARPVQRRASANAGLHRLWPPPWLCWPPLRPASEARARSLAKLAPEVLPPLWPAREAFSRSLAKLPGLVSLVPPRWPDRSWSRAMSFLLASGIGLARNCAMQYFRTGAGGLCSIDMAQG